MSERDDLLSKADALMARRRPARPDPETDPAIPVLEDVVDLAAESGELPVLTELVDLDPLEPGRHEPGLAGPARIEPTLIEPERIEPGLARADRYDEPAAGLQASLLAALQPTIDTLIAERLKEDLAPLIERLYDELRDELQRVARSTLSEAVKLALEEELARRRSKG